MPSTYEVYAVIICDQCLCVGQSFFHGANISESHLALSRIIIV